MKRFIQESCNAKLLSPLTLAFIGDTVYDLFVRETLVCKANRPVKKLHLLAVEQVKAKSQAEYAKKIFEHLTEDEKDIFIRGRNAHTGHIPKNASVEDYHYATALEALFGFLYLNENIERLRELFFVLHMNEKE